MKDLLDSLLVGYHQTMHSNSSQDSFYSTEGQSKPPAQQSTTPAHNSLRVQDVDAYLADPRNAALLSSTATDSNEEECKQNNISRKENPPIQPTQLGVQTSHYVSLLHQQCQVKGLTPIFEIEGEASQAMFKGSLKICDATIKLDDHYHTKKEVRERLAEKGLEVVKGIEARKRADPSTGTEVVGVEKGPNWVGMLQEYHNLEFGPAQSPIYTFYALGQSYASTAIIPAYPDKPFGSPSQTFPSKKIAQRTAAAAAVQFLISEGRLTSDGRPIARKKAKHGGGGGGCSVKFQAEGNGLEINQDSTYTQKVHDMALLLALNTPVYHLNPESTDAPNILSGYLSFPNNPSFLPARLGEIRNVFGKKAAKEEVAKGAWEALLDLAEKRGAMLVNRGRETEHE